MNTPAIYSRLSEIVAKTGNTAAWAHGVLAALLCVDAETQPEVWFRLAFDEAFAEFNDSDVNILKAWCEATRAAFADPDYGFQPALPDEGSDLAAIVGGLAEWCQGFLFGLGSQTASLDGWSDIAREIVHDFGEIARIDPEYIEESDEDDFVEIAEYVRVGVQLIREEWIDRSRRA